MVRCASCQIKPKNELGLQNIINMIRFNVGHIIHLFQIAPSGQHYALEVISGNAIVVHNTTLGHSELVNLNQFKQIYGGCLWTKLEAITW